MIQTIPIRTKQNGGISITHIIEHEVKSSSVTDGLCVVYCPHTTAAITINEDADADVVSDIALGLDQSFPDNPRFNHVEGNSAAHIKASVIGSSVTLIIENGRLLLGRWQGIFFFEFDGPRERIVYVKIIQNSSSQS